MPFPKEKIFNALPFGLILGLAFFLRFYKIDQFQYDSDELSAIFRAQNALTWNQHIQNGILIDGHPAGVQTFIWFWIKLFSNNPLPLKIITAIIGILNVVLVFAISRKIFNQKSAFFAMLCMATLWWQVDLSLWVRPYIFGQLFTLLSLYLLNVAEKETQLTRFRWILLSFSIAGAFYSHYFATLTVGLLCLSIFILQPLKRKQMLKSFWLFCLLGIPQISIVWNQLKIGGLDWLGKPSPSFFWNHLIYHFNGSPTLCLFVLFFIFTGIYFIRKLKTSQNFGIAFLFLLLWFLPMMIGYTYSIYSKPVLQNNVLFFAAPLFILGIGYFFQSIPKYIFIFAMSLVGSISVFQIFAIKHRFDIEVKDVYASQIATLNASLNSKTFNFIDGPNDIFQFHQNKINTSLNLLTSENIWMMSQNKWNLHDLFLSLKKIRGKSTLRFMSNAGTNPVLRPLLYDYFPNSIINSHYIGGQIDEFNITALNDTHYLTKIHKNLNRFPFMLANETLQSTNINYTYSFSSDNFGKYIVNNHSLVKAAIQPNDLIVIKMDKNEFMSDAKIVTAIINHESSLFSKSEHLEQIDFRYTHCADFWNAGFGIAYHVLKLSDIPNWNQNSELRITIETSNPSIQRVPIAIYRFNGNPYQYGIY